ncbi:MAG: 1-(5-phosphoribosyl)-5-[(5-phosphoribosylamino)methylideneamino]imidazole-4-carboxamide isomerase [Desulfonauticus sp.]|nr:1-(5-phosphoribosyl)-5-[(5-phosphoribosylamino)methylideneamino]imidazole-4-carboxamide isomerase [Desulfonauticus sp.]
MIIFPAIDIKDGKCVRLKQGLANKQTIYFEDPLDAAAFLQDKGAKWFHIVDLDGAFEGKPKNIRLIEKICSKFHIPVQLGGGIRTEEVIRAYFDVGVSRLIIGTMALERPQYFEQILARNLGQIGVSLDAKQGRLKTKGWVEDVDKTIEEVIGWLNDIGISFLIYTDIARDGMQSGVNLTNLQHILKLSQVPVLIAGGVNSLEDIKLLYPYHKQGLEGVITGRAIYEGSLDLTDANNWLEQIKKTNG